MPVTVLETSFAWWTECAGLLAGVLHASGMMKWLKLSTSTVESIEKFPVVWRLMQSYSFVSESMEGRPLTAHHVWVCAFNNIILYY
jgi:hypothetical protein